MIDKIELFFNQYPHYGYLLGTAIMLIVAIGNFKDWNWAVSPGGSRQTSFANAVGRERFRKIMGIIYMIGALLFFFLFYVSNKININ